MYKKCRLSVPDASKSTSTSNTDDAQETPQDEVDSSV